ncbi:MAG: cryptochrome/photolyase family protein [Caulobacteraceae bacterium]|nr:cryptochrome/photolyase family protein [Caulobacter sp.]
MRKGRGALRLVVGDQLSPRAALSSLRDIDPARDVVLMAETMSELTYVRHHKQKIVQTLTAMRRYAEALEADGVSVRYVRYDDKGASGDLPGEVKRALAAQPFERVVMTRTGEWRLEESFDALERELDLPFERREDDRFVCALGEFYDWSRGKAQLTMEFFYREMRRKTGLLMDGGKPAGGRWNYDAENRKRLPAGVEAPERLIIAPEAHARELMAQVERDFPDNFGTLDEYGYATAPDEAEALVRHFIRRILPNFGDWQDFMRAGDPWLWHARVSAAMNLGLIDPLDICRRAEAEYRAGRAPLNAVEGFIRQVIGWREYVRGVYWLRGPEYKKINALDADRKLPWFYWSGETDMACVKDVVEMTRAHAYAHHIQRLMVTGNLAMLLGVHPDEINDWYMVVYADAYEWVELPNTHGMATFADGGIIGSKPYAGSGAYINRMSDYCGGCRYDVKGRTSDDACPFNSLYWEFIARNEKRLSGNHRMGNTYATLRRMDDAERKAIAARAEALKTAFGATPVAG